MNWFLTGFEPVGLGGLGGLVGLVFLGGWGGRGGWGGWGGNKKYPQEYPTVSDIGKGGMSPGVKGLQE